MLAYNLGFMLWILAVEYAGEITIPGMIWLIGGQVALIFVGVGLFHEPITTQQWVGIGVGVIALVLLGGS